MGTESRIWKVNFDTKTAPYIRPRVVANVSSKLMMTMVYELLSLVTFIDTEKSKRLVYPTHFTSRFCYHASKR